ncbi:hypothetical protein CBL_08132 [Carabus blaptoides fortunei]
MHPLPQGRSAGRLQQDNKNVPTGRTTTTTHSMIIENIVTLTMTPLSVRDPSGGQIYHREVSRYYSVFVTVMNEVELSDYFPLRQSCLLFCVRTSAGDCCSLASVTAVMSMLMIGTRLILHPVLDMMCRDMSQ